MIEYIARRTPMGLLVTRDQRALEPRIDLWNHSPGGFECGYGGSGPAQLALAILADHFGDDDTRAVILHQQFKWDVVAQLPKDGWTLRADDVARAVERIERLHPDLVERLRLEMEARAEEAP